MGRCKYTGGSYVCLGHWDYTDDRIVYIRHTPVGTVLWKVVPYDHPAPERIPMNEYVPS